ncbi:hydrogenase-4 component G [Sulfuricurvum sp.]|uniref:hydrogenase-4 component G n=1 Tax=Sulfuricurvum sp. TaxID=2025608 RepID=UPI0035632698
MQIGTTPLSINPYAQSGVALSETDAKDFHDKIKNGEMSGKVLSQAYLVQYSQSVESYSAGNAEAQSTLFDPKKVQDILKSIDFKAIGYTGKAITDMTPDEAKALVSEDGYFGITQTSARLSDFVLSGGGDSVEKLKAGREGIINGFNEAEKMWGGKLPDISYQTLEKALAKVDEKITALGGSILDTTA